jgi:surface-anchored protein
MKTSTLKTFFLAGIAAGSLAWAPLANAQVYYSTGHGDLGIAFEEGELEPHWHLASGEYAPGDVVAVVSATRSAPNSSETFLNVAQGTSIYVAGSAAYQPNLGFGAEELVPDDWTGPITVTLSGLTGPGNFALYTLNLNGDLSNILMSSYNPSSTFANNTLSLLPGDHAHYTFGFTEAGIYDITLTWSGTHVTEGFQSASGTFQFEVVPEPGTWALLTIGLVAMMIVVRKRRLAL